MKSSACIGQIKLVCIKLVCIILLLLFFKIYTTVLLNMALPNIGEQTNRIQQITGELNNDDDLVETGEQNNDVLLKSRLDGPRGKYLSTERYPRSSGVDFYSRLDGPLLQDNPFVVKIIKEEFLSSPPSKQRRDPFNKEMSKKYISQFGQDLFVIKLLNEFKGGFFIECGASDGRGISNTLLLELKHDWTGLLVEASPHTYKKLKSIHRHAYLINSCLSTSSYPEKIDFRIYKGHASNHLGGLVFGGKANNDVWRGKRLNISETIRTQCFPLFSILLALENPTVHYFSLDVEGHELEVLKTIPWNLVDIKVLTVEIKHSDKDSINELMKRNNYTCHSIGSELLKQHDFFFIKKGFKVNSTFLSSTEI